MRGIISTITEMGIVKYATKMEISMKGSSKTTFSKEWVNIIMSICNAGTLVDGNKEGNMVTRS